MNFNFMMKPKKLGLRNLKKEQRKNKGKKPEILMMILIIIIVFTFFAGVSLGKAVYNANIKNNTEIAKPILEVEKDSEILITEDNRNGEYHFIVKNYNQEKEVSQVDLVYYIEILEENLDESIQYQLYQGNERLELKENKTKDMTFRGNIEQQQNYTLKVTYDASKNTMEDIMQDIQIKVHSEQLKI